MVAGPGWQRGKWWEGSGFGHTLKVDQWIRCRARYGVCDKEQSQGVLDIKSVCVCVCVCVCAGAHMLCSVVSDSLQPHEL